MVVVKLEWKITHPICRQNMNKCLKSRSYRATLTYLTELANWQGGIKTTNPYCLPRFVWRKVPDIDIGVGDKNKVARWWKNFCGDSLNYTSGNYTPWDEKNQPRNHDASQSPLYIYIIYMYRIIWVGTSHPPQSGNWWRIGPIGTYRWRHRLLQGGGGWTQRIHHNSWLLGWWGDPIWTPFTSL